jgi:hypothetical protein
MAMHNETSALEKPLSNECKGLPRPEGTSVP